EAVHPAVADVTHVDGGLGEVHRGDGGAHPAVVRVPACGLVDAGVCELDPGGQPVLVVVPVLVHLERPGHVPVGGRGTEELGQLVDGDLAGNLASEVPAHAIGDAVEPLLRHQEEAVLVDVAFHADVALACDLDAHRWRTVDASKARKDGSKTRGNFDACRFSAPSLLHFTWS